jgi:uncharacterized RmlC-like cupin family protein
MQIVTRKDGIFVQKDEGTKVVYHIFPEFELHYNEVPAGASQIWHHHEVIEEILYILSGGLEARWREDGKDHPQNSQIVKVGDVVRVENTPHTFINSSKKTCTFIVFRFVPTGTDKRETLKSDKHFD